jgi:hypothetical protein
MISSRSNVEFNNCQGRDVLLEFNALRINRPNYSYELTLEDEYVGGLMRKLLTALECIRIEHSSLCFQTIQTTVFSKNSRQVVGLTHPPFQEAPSGAPSLSVKWRGHEAKQSSPFICEVNR